MAGAECEAVRIVYETQGRPLWGYLLVFALVSLAFEGVKSLWRNR